MNSFDDLTPDCLGHAGVVYEHVLVGVNSAFINRMRVRESHVVFTQGALM